MKISTQMTSRTRLAFSLLALYGFSTSAVLASERHEESLLQPSIPQHALSPKEEGMFEFTRASTEKRKLRGKELRLALAGKKITPDTATNQTALDFTEFFHSDGSWMSTRRERSLVQKSGTWSVEGGKICVKIDGAKKGACREFWFSENPPRAYSHDLDSGPLHSGVITFLVAPIS